MEARLDGKIALVTGATQGLGAEIATLAAHSGVAGLLLTGRSAERGAAVAARIRELGTDTHFIPADLARPDAPARIVQECLDRFGRIDLLVNAAGLTDRASVVDGDIDMWAKLFDVNARAPFFLMQAAIRAMREQGSGGSIVNILSMNAHCGLPDLAIYSATKGALTTLTRNAANAHRHDRIKINGINMGWVPTDGEKTMQGETLAQGDGWLAEADAAQPFGRLVAVEEVANLAVFLLSDASGPMTGALVDQEQWVVGAAR